LKDKGVTPIMWDDMMRNWPVEFLKGRTSLVKTLNMEFKKQRWQRQKLMIYLVEGEKKKIVLHVWHAPWCNFLTPVK